MADADGKKPAARKPAAAKAPAARKPAAKAPAARKPAARKPAAAKKPAAGQAAAAPEATGTAVADRRAGLKIHHLRPAPGSRTATTRVGRGEASKGKTAGRGTKGTKARGSVHPGFEGGQMPLQRRVPKLRGFSNLQFKTTYQVINTGRLAELYPQGGDVTPEDLVAKGAVRPGGLVKVLGTGDADVTLRVTAHAFSAGAREKITAAGGTVTEL